MSKLKFTQSGLMIELDALLDTRIGTLINTGVEFELSDFKNYTKRRSDSFPNMTVEQFCKLYSQRDKATLKHSVICNAALLVSDFAKETFRLNYTGPNAVKPKVYLNIYPYVLEKEEIGILTTTLFAMVEQVADIEIVRMSYKELTPSFVKENLSVLVLYEYYRWLEIHSLSKAFLKTSCPEVTLLAPNIYFKTITGTGDDNPLNAMVELAGPFINLKLLPIEVFSVNERLLQTQKAETPR